MFDSEHTISSRSSQEVRPSAKGAIFNAALFAGVLGFAASQGVFTPNAESNAVPATPTASSSPERITQPEYRRVTREEVFGKEPLFMKVELPAPESAIYRGNITFYEEVMALSKKESDDGVSEQYLVAIVGPNGVESTELVAPIDQLFLLQ